MTNVIPLAVSGQIAPNQESILMSIVNATPYYLVLDVNGVPYFQPLYQDVNTGLAVFSDFAARVTISLGARGNKENSAYITSLSLTHLGQFLTDPTLLRVVAPQPPGIGRTPVIPIEPLTYADNTLVTCGYNYVLDDGYSFYITANWSATPNAQSISSIAQQAPTNSFYVFPVADLVDSSGKPASGTIFSTLYNDVLGRTPETFLFTSFAAWQAGAGEPYYYCSDSKCAEGCFGLCNGSYLGCHRMKDSKFACSITVSWQCKILAVLPFLIPSILSMLAFLGVFLGSKYTYIDPQTGVRGHGYMPTTKTKIVLAVLLAIPVVLIIIMILLININNNDTNWYLRRMCSLSGEFQ